MTMLKIAVVGTRGFPGVQGGVESHCERIYPLIAEDGYRVIVFARKPYVDFKIKDYKGIELIAINCPKHKFLEAITHTFKAVFAAKKMKIDIIHFHGIGPSILVPLARVLGLKTVMTHHGPDYMRKKWGTFAKFLLRLGERIAVNSADKLICISKNIADEIKIKYNIDSYIIPNGVDIPSIADSKDMPDKLFLETKKYILAVGRFVPEKGFHDLIDAFKQADLRDWKLVIAGDADHEDEYSLRLKDKAKTTDGVILAGFLTGKDLKELYSHAGLFILPSYYEGLPITLLEALSYGLQCVVSNISANKCCSLNNDNYFIPGNIKELANKMKEFTKITLNEDKRNKQIEMLKNGFNWIDIAKQTAQVYKEIAN